MLPSFKACFYFDRSAYQTPIVSRPRFLIRGDTESGHTTHVAPALLHHLERLPVHTLDLPALYANSARQPEESCAQVMIQSFPGHTAVMAENSIMATGEKPLRLFCSPARVFHTKIDCVDAISLSQKCSIVF